ncbi:MULTISPECIES: hypothetical protein [unclassified Duganella]|uniref:hypothetical protein n=1 Tax=unclassified Duganella TaxID=2636909 RepID=UPI00088E134D|nr:MULTISPECIES: hypothetical protein [unclassified Duganella]SDH02472.1 hypothetical protein SAMN05216320_10930 [Duganella sp. OV458]SDK23723.1 hypothetical protein SAMN05428973_109252 [Duganella sp. OV510]
MVFERMLGSGDALAYLRAEAVPEELIERVLYSESRRPPSVVSMQDALSLSSKLAERFYCNNGRRRDAIKTAVVQAALSLHAQLGSERVRQLMRREALPEEVIERVLHQAEGTLRLRLPPPE